MIKLVLMLNLKTFLDIMFAPKDARKIWKDIRTIIAVSILRIRKRILNGYHKGFCGSEIRGVPAKKTSFVNGIL